VSAKFCLFCGERPEGKSKEHVLPRWLIELTGEPTRIANFGLDLSQDIEAAAPRQFAFSQFQFPACAVCNGEFSTLEGKAKKVISKILAAERLVAQDISALLDWFDKVRVGLWLGYHQLDKNFEGIRPRFYVQHRIGQKDRLLVFASRADERHLLSFVGPTCVAFRFLPSALGLVINRLCFVNISCDYLLARRLGFPHPSTPITSIAQQTPDYCELGRGLHRVLRPVYAGPLQLDGAIFYQPMFPSELTGPPRPLYEAEYVKSHSLDWEAGVGGIYYSNGDHFRWLDGRGQLTNIATDPRCEGAEKKMVRSVYSTLKYLCTRHSPNYISRTAEDRKFIGLRQKLILKELQSLERWGRSMPDRPWVKDPPPSPARLRLSEH
jgi:hypothetical protein